MVAIIPAAGLGTRMAAVTGGKPKELLRLGAKTVLQRVIEEAHEIEPSRIVVVSSAQKPELAEAAKSFGAEVVLQGRPLGLADAIACADVEDETLVLYGDCAYFGGTPSPRMSDLVRRGISGCISVEPVEEVDVRRYGIVEIDERSGGILRILEKPSPEDTASRWAISARFAFGAPLMAFQRDYMARAHIEEGSELSMTPIFNAAIAEGHDLKAVALQPGQQRIDCGNPEDYSQGRWLNWDQ